VRPEDEASASQIRSTIVVKEKPYPTQFSNHREQVYLTPADFAESFLTFSNQGKETTFIFVI